MTFKEIYDALRDGLSVRRPGVEPFHLADVEFVTHPDNPIPPQVVFRADSEEPKFIELLAGQIMADDWEIVRTPETLLNWQEAISAMEAGATVIMKDQPTRQITIYNGMMAINGQFYRTYYPCPEPAFRIWKVVGTRKSP